MASDKDFLQLLGKRIVYFRKLKGLTQVELANLIGMDKQNLYVIEKGLSNPQVLTIVKIAAGLGVTVEELTTFKFNYDDFLESPRKFKPRKH
jgi:transcriptional regulator with XRE-family HTH domain